MKRVDGKLSNEGFISKAPEKEMCIRDRDYVVYECPFSLFKFFHQASCSGDAYNVYVCCILIYTIIIPYHQNVNTGKHHDTGAQVTSYRSVDRETVVAAVLILYFFGHSMYIKR